MAIERRLAIAAVLAGTLAAPALAQSQYLVSVNASVTGVVCEDFGANGLAEGTYTLDLPLPAPNVIAYSVQDNAAPVEETTYLPGPFPQTIDYQPFFGNVFFAPPTPTPPPWTLVQTIFPFENGLPTGMGVQVTVTCAADGSGTVEYLNGIPAPGSAAPAAVPTLSLPALALLSLLVASVVGSRLGGHGRPKRV